MKIISIKFRDGKMTAINKNNLTFLWHSILPCAWSGTVLKSVIRFTNAINPQLVDTIAFYYFFINCKLSSDFSLKGEERGLAT